MGGRGAAKPAKKGMKWKKRRRRRRRSGGGLK
jgi:hypothetical protein